MPKLRLALCQLAPCRWHWGTAGMGSLPTIKARTIEIGVVSGALLLLPFRLAFSFHIFTRSSPTEETKFLLQPWRICHLAEAKGHHSQSGWSLRGREAEGNAEEYKPFTPGGGVPEKKPHSGTVPLIFRRTSCLTGRQGSCGKPYGSSSKTLQVGLAHDATIPLLSI